MNQKIRIKLKSFDHNLVDKSAEKIVKTVKSTGCKRPGAPSHAQADFHGEPLDFRQQESPRAVPALHLQAHPRHLFVDAQNDRRADETGASLRCGGRNQGVITEGLYLLSIATKDHFIYNKQSTTNVRTYWKENRNDFRLQCRG